jgi:hypothetical protein
LPFGIGGGWVSSYQLYNNPYDEGVDIGFYIASIAL